MLSLGVEKGAAVFKQLVHEILNHGLRLKQVLSMVVVPADKADGSALLTAVLETAMERNNLEIFEYLWGGAHELQPIWELYHFRHLASLIKGKGKFELEVLDILLNRSNAANSLFLQMPVNEKLQFVQTFYERFGKQGEILQILSKPYYAPYLLVELIDKQTFMKSKTFSNTLESCTAFELEELSRIPDVEERFVKFLKYIEILSPSDPAKAEGQKLISIIFSIEKYKAYQNVSLQLFDQESMVYEEEAITHDIRHTIVHQEMVPQMVVNNSRASAAQQMGPKSSDFNPEVLFSEMKAGRQDSVIETLKRFRL